MVWLCGCSISSLLQGQRGWVRQALSAALSTGCGKCCRNHCPQQGDALGSCSFLHPWLWSWPPWGAATTIWAGPRALPVCSSGVPGQPPCTPWQTEAVWGQQTQGWQRVSIAVWPWAAAQRCSMAQTVCSLLSRFCKQSSKLRNTMGAGSQRYAILGKAVRISR